MKAEFKGKRTVVLTLTTKQLDAIRAALDSVTSVSSGGKTYKDVGNAEIALGEAINGAFKKLREKRK